MGVSQVPAAGVAMLVAAVLAGCAGGAGSNGQATTGTVHGTITMTGGPRGASPAGGAGTVVARKSGTQMARQDVAQGQQFSFQLPAGKYQLSVSGAGLPCPDATVTVAANADRSVTLVCSRK